MCKSKLHFLSVLRSIPLQGTRNKNLPPRGSRKKQIYYKDTREFDRKIIVENNAGIHRK